MYTSKLSNETLYIQQQADDVSTTSGQSTSGQTDVEEPSKNCILCGKTDLQKSRYGIWGESERTYLEQYFGSVPADSSMICRKHLIEAKRHCHSLDHTPSWKTHVQKTSNTTNKCINPKCKTVQGEKLIKPMFAPMDKLCEILRRYQTNSSAVICSLP